MARNLTSRVRIRDGPPSYFTAKKFNGNAIKSNSIALKQESKGWSEGRGPLSEETVAPVSTQHTQTKPVQYYTKIHTDGWHG